jgi:hypothetical protein
MAKRLGNSMPYSEVYSKWKKGKLHSGSKTGPTVKSHEQATAIYLSEKRKAEEGKKEYKKKKHRKRSSK